MKIIVRDVEMSDKEAMGYIKEAPKGTEEIIISAVPDDPESVQLEFVIPARKFIRIRRITGYLVGDMTRWNDAKKAEEKDRVKHM